MAHSLVYDCFGDVVPFEAAVRHVFCVRIRLFFCQAALEFRHRIARCLVDNEAWKLHAPKVEWRFLVTVRLDRFVDLVSWLHLGRVERIGIGVWVIARVDVGLSAGRADQEEGLDPLGVLTGVKHGLVPSDGMGGEQELLGQVEGIDQLRPPLDHPILARIYTFVEGWALLPLSVQSIAHVVEKHQSVMLGELLQYFPEADCAEEEAMGHHERLLLPAVAAIDDRPDLERSAINLDLGELPLKVVQRKAAHLK